MQQLLMRRPDLGALPPIPALPEGYVLREYQEGDLESLAALMRAAYQDNQWTPEKTHKTFVEDTSVKKTFVIEHRGKIVATASARLTPDKFPDSGYVHWVAADPAEKGRGLGYVVTLATLHAFVQLGCKDAVLETDDYRLPAIKTYQKLGFAPEHAHETHPERWAKILADLLAAANL